MSRSSRTAPASEKALRELTSTKGEVEYGTALLKRDVDDRVADRRLA